ncbi:hypothetical protein JKP88DRAFT_179630, partial [Tribonema minus]
MRYAHPPHNPPPNPPPPPPQTPPPPLLFPPAPRSRVTPYRRASRLLTSESLSCYAHHTNNARSPLPPPPSISPQYTFTCLHPQPHRVTLTPPPPHPPPPPPLHDLRARAAIKRTDYTPAEDAAVLAGHAQLGNRWSQIALSVPGRTENSIR